MAAAAAFSALGLGGQPKGLPIDIIAIPQCAIPHSGSCSRSLAKDFLAGSNQKEWNKAIARLNSLCAVALHDTGKFTSPSLSGGAPCGVSSSPCPHATGAPTQSRITNIHAIHFSTSTICSQPEIPYWGNVSLFTIAILPFRENDHSVNFNLNMFIHRDVVKSLPKIWVRSILLAG